MRKYLILLSLLCCFLYNTPYAQVLMTLSEYSLSNSQIYLSQTVTARFIVQVNVSTPEAYLTISLPNFQTVADQQKVKVSAVSPSTAILDTILPGDSIWNRFATRIKADTLAYEIYLPNAQAGMTLELELEITPKSIGSFPILFNATCKNSTNGYTGFPSSSTIVNEQQWNAYQKVVSVQKVPQYSITGYSINGQPAVQLNGSIAKIPASGTLQLVGMCVPGVTFQLGVDDPFTQRCSFVTVTTDVLGQFRYPSTMFSGYSLSAKGSYYFWFSNNQNISILTDDIPTQFGVLQNISYKYVDLSNDLPANFDPTSIRAYSSAFQSFVQGTTQTIPWTTAAVANPTMLAIVNPLTLRHFKEMNARKALEIIFWGGEGIGCVAGAVETVGAACIPFIATTANMNILGLADYIDDAGYKDVSANLRLFGDVSSAVIGIGSLIGFAKALSQPQIAYYSLQIANDIFSGLYDFADIMELADPINGGKYYQVQATSKTDASKKVSLLIKTTPSTTSVRSTISKYSVANVEYVRFYSLNGKQIATPVAFNGKYNPALNKSNTKAPNCVLITYNATQKKNVVFHMCK